MALMLPAVNTMTTSCVITENDVSMGLTIHGAIGTLTFAMVSMTVTTGRMKQTVSTYVTNCFKHTVPFLGKLKILSQ